MVTRVNLQQMPGEQSFNLSTYYGFTVDKSKI